MIYKSFSIKNIYLVNQIIRNMRFRKSSYLFFLSLPPHFSRKHKKNQKKISNIIDEVGTFDR